MFRNWLITRPLKKMDAVWIGYKSGTSEQPLLGKALLSLAYG